MRMAMVGLLPQGVLCSAMALLGACGAPVSSSDKKPGDVLSPTFDKSFAESYELFDADCQTGQGLASISQARAWLWNGSATVSTAKKLENASSRYSLIGQGIKETSYNFHQRAICADGTCSSNGTVVNAPTSLKVCKNNFMYARNTVEGIALTGLVILGGARQFYGSLEGADEKLPDAHLMVLPTVEKIENGQRSVTTDNLAYTSSFGGDPAFLIYPKGKRAALLGMWQDLNLWELPWGLAHEFGHHVFGYHAALERKVGSLSALLMQKSPVPIHSIQFDQDEATQDGEDSASLALVQMTAQDPVKIWGAINEAFADLYASYALGGKAGLTDRVDCFEKSRDIASATFYSGASKIMNERALAIFNGEKLAGGSSCNNPSFRDLHTMGAVVAYGVEQIWSEATSQAGLTHKDAQTQKAAWLLQWAARMGQSVNSGEAVSFGGLIQEALPFAARSGELSASQCASLRRVFPALIDELLNGSTRCPS